MKITFVTTFSKAGYNQYAKRLIDCAKNDLLHFPLLCYTEDLHAFDTVESKKVTFLPLTSQNLFDFQRRNKHKQAPSYLQDACRFAFKSYVQCEAAKHLDGYMIWIDADCYADKSIPAEFWENILPQENECASYLGRKGSYTETGLIIYNLDNPQTRHMLQKIEDIYNTDEIYNLDFQTDCHVFDEARKGFKCKNLTPESTDFNHCFLDVFGDYMDHTKGYRKLKGYSPERKK